MTSLINPVTTQIIDEIVTLQKEHLATVRETIQIHEEISDLSNYTSGIRQQTSDIQTQNEVMKNVTVQINSKIRQICDDIELKKVKMSQELEEAKRITEHRKNKEDKLKEVVNMIENILTY